MARQHALTGLQRLATIGLALLAVACSSVSGDWQQARGRDSIEAYRAFVARHPAASTVPLARQRIAALEERAEFERLQQAPTRETIDQFVAKYPRGEYAKRVQPLRDRIPFDEAAQLDTMPGWEAFLRANPRSPHRAQAAERLEAFEPSAAAREAVAQAAQAEASSGTKTLAVVAVDLQAPNVSLVLKRPGGRYIELGPGMVPRDYDGGVDLPDLKHLRADSAAVLRLPLRSVVDPRLGSTLRPIFEMLGQQLAPRGARPFLWIPGPGVVTGTEADLNARLAEHFAPVPSLVAMLASTDLSARRLAVGALRQLRTPESTRALVAAVASTDAEVRAGASAALSERGTEGVEALRAAVAAEPAAAGGAARLLHRIAFDEARSTDTDASYRGYLERYPDSEFAWLARCRLRDRAQPPAASKGAGAERGIAELVEAKQIEVKIEGAGIQSVRVGVRRLVAQPLSVQIPAGTYFVSARKSAQNMVSTAHKRLTLSHGDWHWVSIPAACANRALAVPGGADTFTVRSSPQQAELVRLMPVLERAAVDYATRQAAVWIVTDDATFSDLAVLRRGGSSVIGMTQVVRAMQILRDACIDVTSKRIGRQVTLPPAAASAAPRR